MILAVNSLTSRGLMDAGKLTDYGRQVEAMPVDRQWGELLVHAGAEVAPVVAVCSNIDSLHRMCREERDLAGLIVKGSDHLTAYNGIAEAGELQILASGPDQAGPSDVHEALMSGRFFRLAGDGGAGLAIGRLYDPSGDNERAPLDDFGRKNLGATQIAYRLEGDWRPL